MGLVALGCTRATGLGDVPIGPDASDPDPIDAALDGSDAPDAGPTDFPLATGHFEPADLPLEIVAPAVDASALSRYARAYPGLPLRLPIVALGGAWPHRYELISGPPGATIGELLPTDWQEGGYRDYSVLSWPNSIERPEPYSLDVRVTDQEGTSVSVAWSLKVTREQFVFVDAAGGDDGNPGTIESPFRTIEGWYRSDKYDDTYRDHVVYYRGGTYATSVAPIEDGARIALVGPKPRVHLAYPGEMPVLDVTNAHLSLYGDVDDLFFGGLGFVGLGAASAYKSIALEGASRLGIFECSFGGQRDRGVVGANPAHVFFARAGSVGTRGFIRGCVFDGIDGTLGMEGYSTHRYVLEDNVATNLVEGVLFYAKNDNTFLSVRANRGLDRIHGPLLLADTWGPADQIECVWNSWRVSPGDVLLEIGRETSPLGAIYVRRNTLAGGHVRHANATGGDVVYARNVIEHDGRHPDALEDAAAFTATWTENLIATGGLLDARNRLVGEARSARGTRGAEVS